MRIKVLGSAAGGGLPQWNCNCSNCAAARAGAIPSRRIAAIAATGDDRHWVIVNAGLDICAQIGASPELAPTQKRGSPIVALLFTDANIDHAAGLVEFRQAGELVIYSSELVKATLCRSPMFAQFDSRFAWRTFACDHQAVRVEDGLVAGLSIFAIPLAGRLPSYAGGASEPGAAVAYRLQQRERSALYAPIFLEVDEELAREAGRCDAIFLDGTCWQDDEMIALGLGVRTAREMGHAPMMGPQGSLVHFSTSRARHRYYTHVNNSNPILDPGSGASRELARAGFAVCDDGLEIAI